MKHLNEQSEKSETAQQRGVLSRIWIGSSSGEITQSESQRQRQSDPPRSHPQIALDDVAEQIRKFFL